MYYVLWLYQEPAVIKYGGYMDYYNNYRYQCDLNKMTPVEYRIHLLESGQPLLNKIIKAESTIVQSASFWLNFSRESPSGLNTLIKHFFYLCPWLWVLFRPSNKNGLFIFHWKISLKIV